MDTKKTIFQGHCRNKIDIELSYVYYVIVSYRRIFTFFLKIVLAFFRKFSNFGSFLIVGK